MKKISSVILLTSVLIISISMIVCGAKLKRTQLFPSTGRLIPPDDIKDYHIKRQFMVIKKWADKLQQMLDTTFRKVADIPFNQSEALTVADSGNADTEFSINHHLGRVPNGYIITKSDKACCVYDSGTAWTSTTVYLKCDAANTALSISVF